MLSVQKPVAALQVDQDPQPGAFSIAVYGEEAAAQDAEAEYEEPQSVWADSWQGSTSADERVRSLGDFSWFGQQHVSAQMGAYAGFLPPACAACLCWCACCQNTHRSAKAWASVSWHGHIATCLLLHVSKGGSTWLAQASASLAGSASWLVYAGGVGSFRPTATLLLHHLHAQCYFCAYLSRHLLPCTNL